MPQNRVGYRAALKDQANCLDQVVKHVHDSLDALPPRGHEARPAFLGIGASLAACALPVHLLRQRGVAAHRVQAGTLPEACPPLGDVTVAVSQSGRSKETVADFDTVPADARLAVVNVAASPLGSREGECLDLGSQPDSKASTTGFTGTLVGLAMLAERWAASDVAAPRGQWSLLGGHVQHVSTQVQPLAASLAELMSAVSSVDVIGEGVSVTSAEEGALLLREVCRVAASAHELRNYLHGPQESARSGIGPKSTGHLILGQTRTMVRLATELADQGHRVGLITSTSVAEPLRTQMPHIVVVPLPEVPDAQRPILETVVTQHLALEVADAIGVDPDEFLHTSSDTKIPGEG